MTERVLDSDLQASTESSEFLYCIFVDLAFDSGNLRVHNGVGTYSFNGNDYLGVGTFGSIDSIVDTLVNVANPISLVLSGIDQSILAAVKNDDVFGRDADIYVGHVDEHGVLKGTPTNWVSGYMEFAKLNIGKTDAVVIQVQGRAAKLKRRNNKRYTLEDHQADYPGDLFFEFLYRLIEASVNWGGGGISTGSRGGGISGGREGRKRHRFN
jgi:hypothetical protein